MAIRSRNKISVSFSMAGMSDIVFLLLIFLYDNINPDPSHST